MADNSKFGFKNMGHMSASGRRRGAFRRQSGEGQVTGFATGELAVFLPRKRRCVRTLGLALTTSG